MPENETTALTSQYRRRTATAILSAGKMAVGLSSASVGDAGRIENVTRLENDGHIDHLAVDCRCRAITLLDCYRHSSRPINFLFRGCEGCVYMRNLTRVDAELSTKTQI